MPARINVRAAIYGAKGDGKTDDTRAFRRALAAAAESGGATVVVPARKYRLTEPLRIPPDVVLLGTLDAPPFYRSIQKIPDSVTTLLADVPEGGAEDEPFLTLEGPNSVVRGLAIAYPGQDDPDDIREFPWTIADGAETGSNNAVLDVFLLNSYRGVDFSRGSRRHTIRRLTGQPLHTGIRIDRSTDVGRIQEIHFWPFWSDAPNVVAHMAREGTALLFKNSDWQIVDNFFAFGYRTGIRFEESDFVDPRIDAKKSGNGQITNLNLDSVGIGLDVHSIKVQGGIQVANANIALGKFDEHYDPPRNAIRGRSANNGTLIVRGLSVWGRFDEIVDWDSPGRLLLTSSVLVGKHGEDFSALKIRRGRATIQGNTFASRFQHAVEIGSDVAEVFVMQNQLFGNDIVGDEHPKARVEMNY